jgi:hypothetical protein
MGTVPASAVWTIAAKSQFCEIHANCSYVKTAYVDCGNKGGTIGHYYSHY